MFEARTPTASSSDSSAHPSGYPDCTGLVEELPFLWEQISASLDPVELHEVSRVVGSALIQSCEDVYAELRALKDILSDYSAETDEQIRISSSLKPQKSGLLELELQSLVEALRRRASESGTSIHTLLPLNSGPHQKVLEKILGGDSNIATHRSLDEACERLSLRDLRACGGSRPSTASRPSSAAHFHASSRPRTSCGVGASTQVLSLDTDAPRSCTADAAGVGSSPGGSVAGSRPQTAASGGSASSSGSFAVEALESSRRSRGGVVIAQLRNALEEERQALLAQTEQLRLSIYDEHEYRDRSIMPPPVRVPA